MKKRGSELLKDSYSNKDTAFTMEERKKLGLIGLLPPVVTTLEEQERRTYRQYQEQGDELRKNIYLTEAWT